MSTDLSKSSLEQVLDLIRLTNDLNAAQLHSGDIDLSSPVVLTEGNKNTGVTLISKENRRYVGNVDVTYNRLLLQGLENYGSLTVEINEGEGEAEIIAAINAAYGSNLSTEDITLSSISDVDYDGDDVTITAKAFSLAWIGVLTLTIKWKQLALSSILVNQVMNGLKWPGVAMSQLEGFYENQPDFAATYSRAFAVYYEGFIYVVPGTTNGATSRVFFKYEVETGIITNLPQTPFNVSTNTNGLIHAHAGKIYLATSGQNRSFDIANNAWDASVISGIAIASGNNVVWKGSKMYHIGNAATLTEIDIVTGALGTNATIPAGARGAWHCAAIVGDDLHLFTRPNGTPTQHWKLNLTSRQWTQLANCPRLWMDTYPCSLGNFVYFYGNSNSTTPTETSTLHEYDVVNDTWRLVNSGPYPCLDNCAVMSPEGMFLIGGVSGGQRNGKFIKIT